MLARLRNRLALLDTRKSAPLALNGPIASFTFDDFPASAYTVAGQMIEDAGGRATYFASAQFMGKTVDGIDYYTPAMLQAMHAKGHEIGSHTYHHIRLGGQTVDFAHESIAKNAAAMNEVLGEAFTMTSFAYPFGDVSPPLKWAVSRRFSLCRGVHQALNTGAVDLAQISIISLEARHWNEHRLAATIAQAARNRSWMVFLTHDVSDHPTPYGSTPAMIATTLQLLQAASIPLLTLKAAAEYAVFQPAAAPTFITEPVKA